MTLKQILGYRAIIVETGVNESGSMAENDFHLFDQWLTSSLCNANVNRQVFVMDGDGTGVVMNNWVYGSSFMTNDLGAALLCNAFNGATTDHNCSPEEHAYCVRYLGAPGGVFGAPVDVDAYGNWCPNKYYFNVFNTIGSGIGNRTYAADGGGGKTANYAQIVNENLSAGANYRTVLNGTSLYHLTLRNGSGPDPCPRDNPSIIGAVTSELGAALRWSFGVGDNASIPKLTDAHQLAACEGTWNLPSDVDAGGGNPFVNRLYMNAPNPFNPRTTVKYSLAAIGPVRIVIYDVEGRLVRTLVDSPKMPAGLHDAVWEGTNDRGAHVGSGVYWAQMRAGSFTSNRKMIVIK
jgi:hypothetical protein